MIEFLDSLDTSVFMAINGAHNAFFDSFMTLFTGRFIWIPMYAMMVWILFRNLPRTTATAFLLMVGLAIFLTDQTCSSVIRPMVERLRPSNMQNALSEYAYVVNDYRGGAYGFPSCHAANSFALATFMAIFARRRSFTLFIFGWAILNSYSRLYLGVHYPGDLLVGAIIGAFYGYLCYCLASLLSRRFPSLFPITVPTPTAGSPEASDRIDGNAPSYKGNDRTALDSNQASIDGNDVPALNGSRLMMATVAVTLAFIILSSLLTLYI